MKSPSPYRILVVDDDEALHGIFGGMLAPATELFKPTPVPASLLPGIVMPQTFPTFEIDYAFQGKEGLERIRQAQAEDRPYTMAFVDVRMPPGWDGIETISHVWKESFDLQIIICTGYSDFSWHDLIQRFGHSDRLLILKKPFDMTEVRQVAYSLAEKWDLAHQAQGHLERLQKLVSERTSKLQEANLSLQRKIIENKQAERRLLAQYSVNQALAQSTTLTGALEIIFQIVCRSLNWDWGGLWQVDSLANVLRLSNRWHVSDALFGTFKSLNEQLAIDPGVDLPGRVWSGGKAIWLRDVLTDAHSRRAIVASECGLHGAVAFPICAGTKILGVMEFMSRELQARDKDMLQTFTVISNAIGQFIERKQAEEDLKRERDYIEQIIRETPALVVGIAPDGTTTFVNPSITRHTGYTAAELIGRNWWQLLYPGKEHEQVAQLFADLEKGPLRDYEMVLTTQQGEKRTVSWNSLNKFDDAGRLTEIIGFGTDISERKRSELERRSMEVQLRHAQKLESIGQLAAGIAHEINTPTQYIGDNIRFLQSSFGELNELQKQYQKLLQAARDNTVTPALVTETYESIERANIDFLLHEIPAAIQQTLDGVDRVAHIVCAMKDFSHPGSTEKTPIDLNKAVETTLTVARNEWKYVATTATDFDANLPLVPCLPGELNQVILNLVVNAAHAIADVPASTGKALGVITISTRHLEEWAEIRVGDTGTGIPEKIRGKVFDPFFTTKAVGRGTGQGLAIAHTVIVDRHQGQLTFETELGKGTTFIIRLPLQPAHRNGKEKKQ